MRPFAYKAAAAAVFAALALTGCSEPAHGPVVNAGDGTGNVSDYPAGTYNETSLVFIEDMFSSDVVRVAKRDVGEYTVSSEANRDSFAGGCDAFLPEDVMKSVPDEWQVEGWSLLIDNVNFSSVQPYIQFTDSSGKRWVRFWLDSNFAAVLNNSGGMTFSVSDEVIAAVKKEYDELPTRTSSRRTPEQTVRLLFERFNSRDADGVNELLASPVEDPAFLNVKDEIDTVLDLGHVGNFSAEWYPSPYANRVMYVKFTRTDKTGSQTLAWDVYLVRESADAEWLVAAYG